MGGMKTSRALSWLQLEWRWLVVSILAAHFVLGVVYSLAVPIWEAHDEPAHYGYVRFLVDNLSLPGPKDSTSPLDQLTHPPLYYILTAVATSWVHTGDDLQPVKNPFATTAIVMEGGVNLFLHPDTEAFPFQGTVLAVHAARLFSVFISTLVIVVTYSLGRLLFPDQKEIALGAMAINAFSPEFLFVGSVITNDILVTLFFALTLFFSVKVIIHRPNPRDLFALGVFTGLALLSKYTALALIPLAVISVGLAMARLLRSRRSLAVSLGGLSLLLLGIALIYGWWFFRTVALFGRPTTRSMRIVRQFLRDIRDPLAAVKHVHWDMFPEALRYFYTTFWASFGWGNINAEAWVYQILGLLCLVGISGFILFMLRDASLSVKGGALMLLLSFLFLLALATYRTVIAVAQPTLRGRYVLPSISAVSVLLSLGIVHLTPRKLGRIPILLAGLTVFVLGLMTPFRYLRPAYARPPILSPEESMVVPNPSTINFGNKIELLGYELGTHNVRAGEFLPITLYWRCLAEMEENYTVGLSILGPDNEPHGQLAVYPGNGNYATSLWKEGDIIRDSYQVRVRRRFPAPGVARIHLALYTYPEEEYLSLLNSQGERTGRAAIFERIVVASAREPEYTIEHPLYYNLGDQMALVGYEMEGGEFNVGCLGLTLYWQALANMGEDYTAFIHLVDEEGQMLAQDDSQPRNGFYPTSFWDEGEIVEDEHSVCYPLDLQPGNYDLMVGVYLLETMQRLPSFGADGNRILNDQIKLRELEMLPIRTQSCLPLMLPRGNPEVKG